MERRSIWAFLFILKHNILGFKLYDFFTFFHFKWKFSTFLIWASLSVHLSLFACIIHRNLNQQNLVVFYARDQSDTFGIIAKYERRKRILRLNFLFLDRSIQGKLKLPLKNFRDDKTPQLFSMNRFFEWI